MDSKRSYKKLSELVDSDIVIQSVGLPKYVAWDDVNKKYLTEDNWFKGAQKKYPVTIEYFGDVVVDMSASQVGTMLEAVMHAGQSNIIGATFNVKSNGKTGQEIRYFLNAKSTASVQPQQSGYDTARAKADELRGKEESDRARFESKPAQTTEFSDADMPDFGDL